jgi:hypothetical protein
MSAPSTPSHARNSHHRLIGDAKHFWQRRYYDFNIRNEQQFALSLGQVYSCPIKITACSF